jgi:exopolyphosphatase / guanosine-5'-triphosphate,3'-diphosphate pyrophosphatase
MLVAVIDLGSNSFRMLIAERRLEQEAASTCRCVPHFSLKQTLRLGALVDEKGELSSDGRVRVLRCLVEFAEKIAQWKVSPRYVRAVATHAFRRMKEPSAFLAQAEAALRCPIEIISGEEEARLVFHGVMSELPRSDERRLIVDVGGGSTECVLGNYSEGLLEWVSLDMGCVSWSKRFFGGNTFSEMAFAAAEHEAERLMAPYVSSFEKKGWQAVYASSGTAQALLDVLHANQWSLDKQIPFSVLMHVKVQMITAGSLDGMNLKGLAIERLPVLAGGVALMIAFQRAFKLERMIATEGALLLGLAWDIFRLEGEETVL